MADDATEHAATEIPIACALTSAEQAAWSEGMGRTVFAGYEETRELPDGYALRYPGDERWARTLVRFIVHERGCCPFFTFKLVFEPNHGAIWLYLMGNKDVKAFVEGLIARVR